MKIRLAFYIAGRDGKALDNGIAFHSRNINIPFCLKNKIPLRLLNKLYVSHIEIWTPDNNGNFTIYNRVDNDFYFYGECWTSTMGVAGGKNRKGGGVCKRPATDVFKHPERWLIVEKEISDDAYQKLIYNMDYAVANNRGYETSLISRYFVPRWISSLYDNPNKYICSEFVAEMLDSIDAGYPDTNPSPMRIILREWLLGNKIWNLETNEVLE